MLSGLIVINVSGMIINNVNVGIIINLRDECVKWLIYFFMYEVI